MIDKSNWNPVSLAWLAGILEGEGTFKTSGHSLVIECEMTDEDVIRRLHSTAGFGAVYYSERKVSSGRKPTWAWKSSNTEDVYHFELAIFTFMGERRQKKILTRHVARRMYEESTTGNNLRRIFTPSGRNLLLAA